MLDRRAALDGALPRRVVRIKRKLDLPGDKAFEEVYAGSGKQAASTTTAFTRLLRNLMRDPQFGSRVVPIIPDEARTFGMDSLFKEFGIYASGGQLYEPVDAQLLLAYRESQSGQILEEGITEAGSMASFIAAGTSYATQGTPTVPFFTFYSMFGFQRVGDLIWQATDARARGFLLGATAGRTTLLGEGLQHQDGHSLLLASTNPAVEAYDPAFAYEVAAVIRAGLHRMWGPRSGDEEHPSDPDVIYYLTLYNENYPMPAMPEGADKGAVEGLYRWATAPDGPKQRATILFSGTAQGPAREAQTELAERWDVAADLWSATSYKRLREEALSTERWNRLHPDQPSTLSTRHRAAGRRRSDRGGDRLHEGRSRPDRPLGAVLALLHPARHRRLRSLGHTRGAPPPLRDRHASRGRSHACGSRGTGRHQGRHRRRRHPPLRPRSRSRRPSDPLTAPIPHGSEQGDSVAALLDGEISRSVERLAIARQPH